MCSYDMLLGESIHGDSGLNDTFCGVCDGPESITKDISSIDKSVLLHLQPALFLHPSHTYWLYKAFLFVNPHPH